MYFTRTVLNLLL